ncbi:SMI1/KNR4 family protein [Bradyrhizobium diazoefficiens]|nr:SMI1/KNR4 family protein [Bradyrhizobium diazoefficiens]MBR0779364.1 SMI1/KNR4 family protein [Bradyrhizobium diazoefficiens]MBR0850882.1 SMI1/KNR4 family protein [Bradyrhizobium diazoefficiens]
MRQLDWLDPGHEIDASLIDEAQQAFGVEFPRDYIDLVRQHDDASNPRESSFALVTNQGRRIGSNFGALISLRNGEIYTTIRDLGEQLPGRVIPFALTGHGDYICFDYRRGRANPAVVYYSHEARTEEAISPLTTSLSAFLDLLYVPADL